MERPGPPSSSAEPTKRAPARLVVHTRFAEQVAELSRRDGEARRGDPEGVHKTRVACRRLRGLLAMCRPLVDREVTEPIRAELRWVTHALGEARDLDVVHDRLKRLVDGTPHHLVRGPIRQRIGRAVTPQRDAAHARAQEALSSTRYRALRDELDRLVAAPPWTDRAEERAKDMLPKRLLKDLKRLRARVRRTQRSTDSDAHDEAIHAVRRAAKRLRYAAETLQPTWGEDMAPVVQAAKQMSSVLGQRQDAVVTIPHLLHLAAQAEDAGESSFTYRHLHAEEERSATEISECLGDLFAAVERAVDLSGASTHRPLDT